MLIALFSGACAKGTEINQEDIVILAVRPEGASNLPDASAEAGSAVEVSASSSAQQPAAVVAPTTPPVMAPRMATPSSMLPRAALDPAAPAVAAPPPVLPRTAVDASAPATALADAGVSDSGT